MQQHVGATVAVDRQDLHLDVAGKATRAIGGREILLGLLMLPCLERRIAADRARPMPEIGSPDPSLCQRHRLTAARAREGRPLGGQYRLDARAILTKTCDQHAVGPSSASKSAALAISPITPLRRGSLRWARAKSSAVRLST